MGVFKAYDIRGVFDSEIDEDFAYKLGRSIVIFLKASEIIVARDGRLSSDTLHQHLCKGMMDQGASVHDIGISSSPHLYFAVQRFEKPGVIITASHNPKEYNGFKIMDKNLDAVHLKNGLLGIKKLVDNPNFQEPYKRGNYIALSTKKYYLDFLKKFVVDKDISFVVDASNGSGKIEADFLNATYNNCIVINDEVDGNFPNHSPDPTNPENHGQIRKRILDTKSDFGVIFDGDADRAIFLDEKGQAIRPEILVSLFNLEGTVLYDVRSSQSLSKACDLKNINSIMVKTGRTNFVSDMREHQAFIGVEGSGHYFFKEFNYLDSAIIAILKLIEVLKTPLSKEIKKHTYYIHSGEMNFKVKNREKAIENIRKSFSPNQILTLDGLSMYFDDYWFSARLSNTEPLVRINAESKSQETLDKFKEKIVEILNNS